MSVCSWYGCTGATAFVDINITPLSYLFLALSDIKPILRKSTKSRISQVPKAVDSGADITSDATPSSNSSQSRSTSVRFHPLALLLDAALEGDIDLVKKAAAQVNSFSYLKWFAFHILNLRSIVSFTYLTHSWISAVESHKYGFIFLQRRLTAIGLISVTRIVDVSLLFLLR